MRPRVVLVHASLVLAWWLSASAPATAQPRPVGAEPREDAVAAPPASAPETDSSFRRFIRDVGRDYRNYLSVDTVEWLAPGSVAALSIHQWDESIREETQEPSSGFQTTLSGGDKYGNLGFQFPLAVTWWIVGHAGGHERTAAAGRDLVRAQISALSWTYALKYSVNRERPNGDPRSFPSGHASATFATAAVLQQHYGWKVGVPFYALSTYTAASRITENKHWASDVVFGAFVGLTAGRAVTVHVRSRKIALAPTPAGLGVQATM